MTFMVIQTQTNSIDCHFIDDGFRVNEEINLAE